jgi:carbon-monoxide dehydrogenase medium subunit
MTVFGYPDAGKPSGCCFRIALASVAPVPLRAVEAETILANKPINEATIAEAALAAMNACNPIDDVRGSARYRKLMVRNLTRLAVTQVYEQIQNQA